MPHLSHDELAQPVCVVLPGSPTFLGPGNIYLTYHPNGTDPHFLKKKAVWEKEADTWAEEMLAEKAHDDQAESDAVRQLKRAREGEAQSVFARPCVFFDIAKNYFRSI